MIYAIFLLVIILAGGHPTAIDPQIFGAKDPSKSFTPGDSRKIGGGYLNFRNFSGALTRAELANRITKLPIPDDVRQILVTCAAEKYTLYIAEFDGVGSRHADKYLGISRKLSDEDKQRLPITTKQIRDQSREAEEIERALISAERNFIQSLQDCLDAELLEARGAQAKDGSIGATILESFILRTGRRYSNSILPISQRGTDLDLRCMIDELDWEFPVRISVEADLLDYERAWSTLKSAQCKACWGGVLQRLMVIDQALAGTIGPTSQASQMDRLMRAPSKIGSQMRVSQINSIERIESKLPAKQQKEFRHLAYSTIYPEIVSDPKGEALRAKFTGILARKDLSKVAFERIESMQSSWELEFKVWRSKAEALLLKWSDLNAAKEKGYRAEEVKIKIQDLLQQRNEIHQNWQVILDDLMPADTSGQTQNEPKAISPGMR